MLSLAYRQTELDPPFVVRTYTQHDGVVSTVLFSSVCVEDHATSVHTVLPLLRVCACCGAQNRKRVLLGV